MKFMIGGMRFRSHLRKEDVELVGFDVDGRVELEVKFNLMSNIPEGMNQMTVYSILIDEPLRTHFMFLYPFC